MLVDPAEADEAGDRLVHPLARGADHAGQFFLRDRQQELVRTLGELEQALGRTTGDVQEHAVGESFVHHAQARGEQAGDAPQQRRIAAERADHGIEGDGEDGGRLERTRHRGAGAGIQHRHLAEQVATVHQRHHGFAVVDGVGDRDRDTAADDEVERIRDIAFAEQHVAADEMEFAAVRGEIPHGGGGRVGEEIGTGEQFFVSHGQSNGTTLAGVSTQQPERTSAGQVSPAAERVWTIVVAGGSGQRFGGLKQYEIVGAQRVLDWSVAAARAAGEGVVIVVPAADAAREGGVAGGASRSESVRNGLAHVPADATIVCVHDGARPFASAEVFARVIDAVAHSADGAIPGVPVADTIKQIAGDGLVVHTPPRAELMAVQTPQAFRASVLRAAHESGAEATDDAALVEAAGGRVVVVAGDVVNRKITDPDDLRWARERVEPAVEGAAMSAPIIRVGQGFDIHRFSDDLARPLVLGGVTFEGARGLHGHSDADAIAHAATDALLGAAGLGDIGEHFPDTDPRWKGADSLELLRHAASLVREAGYRIGNVDCSVVCETPKLAPHKATMQQRLSEAAGAPVTVKGRRAEGLGALGRQEGIAVWASALIIGDEPAVKENDQ